MPYWRHILKDRCDIENPGESETHKLAKELLVNFLSKGDLRVVKRCRKCGTTTKEKVRRCEKYNSEVKIKNGIFDIAGMVDDNVVVGFEVCYRHITDNLEARKNYAWYEFRAYEILDALDVTPFPKSITLYDRRSDRLCDFENDMCINFRLIARRLGYYRVKSYYPKPIYRLLDEAQYGYYFRNKKRWVIRSFQSPFENVVDGWQLTKKRYFDTWGEFVMRDRCLRCKLQRKGLGMGRPYCRKCYLKTRNEENTYVKKEWKLKKSKRREDLHDAFLFLNEVPKLGNCGVCSVCKCEFDTKIVKWNDEEKEICSDCLEFKFLE